MPTNLSFAEAASIPLVTLTAYQGLTRYGGLKSGQKVLVLGASGGAGSAAVQLAKALGASHIVAVCSSKNKEYVKSIGSNHVIPYDENKWSNELMNANYDIIFDCVGGSDAYYSSYKVLKPGGAFVTIAGDKQGNDKTGKLDVSTIFNIASKLVYRKAKSYINGPAYYFFMLDCYSDKSRRELDHITQLIQEGKVKPTIEKVYSLNEVANMWEQSMKGRTVGKLVIEIDSKSVSGSSSPSTSTSTTASSATKAGNY
jgi:NADPH:quinone reductase-like Zn-dependent oxidoreductase